VPTNLEKLRSLLQELFQLDQADLDFGIYRIMNQKRDEIVRFLDNDLLPQVQEAFKEYKSADKAELQKQLDKLVEQITGAGMNPDDSPKVRELRQAITDSSVDVTALENEVFSHLYNFFRRYYHEGDFLSLRRYKEGVYAIPYEGEEVKLHWANADQYYVKSSEYFRDYIFTMPSGKRVRVHLVAASSEQDNKKEAPGKERRFILCEENPIYEENGELFIRFEYRPDDGAKKQDALNQEAIERVLGAQGFGEWIRELSKPAPTKTNPKRTVLEKHLTQYTDRNTLDYFVHKDLGGFLRRELDFYIKNEVMHLDDIEHDTVPRVEQYLSEIKVIRKIAQKIIQFLEQLENFQKKLWLKKKFVVETSYCITLDRVPQELYPEIAANEAQREEWVRLFAVDEIKGDLITAGYSVPLTEAFLAAHHQLLLDTRFFPADFTQRLLSSIDNLSDIECGILIESENFQALNLISQRFASSVKMMYIDPPYNTGSDGFLYKDSYQSSSWLAMMADRLAQARRLLRPEGVIYSSVDEHEHETLMFAFNGTFGRNNRVEEIIWVQNTTHNVPTYSTNHEYVEVYARSRSAAEQNGRMFREAKPGCVEIVELMDRLNPEFPTIAEIEKALAKLMADHRKEFEQELHELGLQYDDETKKLDPWKGIYNYKHAEYRDQSGQLVAESNRMTTEPKIWVWREDNPSMPAGKQSETTRQKGHPNYRFYRPLHPVTKKACPCPKRGWVWPEKPLEGRLSFQELADDNRIVFGETEEKVPQVKRFLHESETNVCKSVIHDYTDGEKEFTNLEGTVGAFPNPKPSTLIQRFVSHTTSGREWVADFFAGSGTTATAVLNQNRLDRKQRCFLLVEMAGYFESALRRRVSKSVYCKDWSGGKPANHTGGVSALYRCLRLESYEDTLNNLELKRTPQQDLAFADDKEVREQYMLSYMLDVESRGSVSLLNVKAFRNPDQYRLRIERNGETQLVSVDLVETFNWLLGLAVKHIDLIQCVRVVDGTTPDGERVLVLWRNVDETNNSALDQWFDKQGYSTRDLEYDLVYVNGDNNLENLRRPDQTWKVRLIEEEFHRLMFDVKDV